MKIKELFKLYNNRVIILASKIKIHEKKFTVKLSARGLTSNKCSKYKSAKKELELA
jgi:hypothetical protein